MLINTVGVLLLAILVGTSSVTYAFDLFGINTSGKEKAKRLREEESSPFSDESFEEALQREKASNEDIFVKIGTRESSEEIPKVGAKSSEEQPWDKEIPCSSEEVV
ncbi:hypothetical protein CHS0354_040405 [Potamilus streckersoni]|uniref:Uncharacterized protein n=1 Tax=Potamilus streckersoni TaxID=2493646 RepID=A0AAE0SZW0_9BIVA|nr:hypothetical protein CHS0354_040405 [Potamilus streckersoni]